MSRSISRGPSADGSSTSRRTSRISSLLLAGALFAAPACDALSTAPELGSELAGHPSVSSDAGEMLAPLAVSPRLATINGIGGVVELAAQGTALQNSILSDSRVTWSTLTPELASVDASGRVVSRAAGVALIVASLGTAADTAALTITGAPVAPAGISELQVASGRVYSAEAGLANTHLAYGDRLSHYEEVPTSLQGLTYIRTRANDQTSTGVSDFLRFQIDRPATVYVAYNGAPPSWITRGGFTPTEENLVVVRDTDKRRLPFQVFAKTYPAGVVTLGSNREGTSAASMYTVIVRPSAQMVLPPRVPSFNEVIAGVRPRGYGKAPYTLLQPAAGRTMYWVSTAGNDANPGTSSAPFRTINQAAQVAQAGDVVTIRNGTYNESVSVRHSGTPSSRIVFQAENRGGVVLGGSNNKVFQPLNWVGEQGKTGAAWVAVRGLVFRDYGEQTRLSSNAVRTGRGWLIEDCLFERSANTGLNVVDHDVEVVRTTFQHHMVHAFLVGTRDLGAATPSDPLYRPLTGIRILDSVLRGNHTTTSTVDGASATRVVKFMLTRGLVIDNVESYENRGAGIWLDTRNTDYTIRNSYFHRNVGFTPTGGTYRGDVARGVYLEKNWSGGVVENNVFMGNEGAGLMLVNTGDVVIRNNLFVRNDRSIMLTNMTGSSATYDAFPFRNIRIEHNLFRDWARSSSIQYPGGPNATPASLNIVANHNTYHPGRVAQLAWWPSPIGGASTVAALQNQFGWEKSGRVATVPWP